MPPMKIATTNAMPAVVPPSTTLSCFAQTTSKPSAQAPEVNTHEPSKNCARRETSATLTPPSSSRRPELSPQLLATFGENGDARIDVGDCDRRACAHQELLDVPAILDAA